MTKWNISSTRWLASLIGGFIMNTKWNMLILPVGCSFSWMLVSSPTTSTSALGKLLPRRWLRLSRRSVNVSFWSVGARCFSFRRQLLLSSLWIGIPKNTLSSICISNRVLHISLGGLSISPRYVVSIPKIKLVLLLFRFFSWFSSCISWGIAMDVFWRFSWDWRWV